MPRLSKFGAAALAAFGWTSGGVTAVTASYLQVAGGGGGSNFFGGGGAGGYLTGTTSLNPTLSYTVTVGAGGAVATQGGNSQFGTLTASVGGGAGASGNGGSGGGSFNSNAAGTGTSGQGNNGGVGVTDGATYNSGGGGGGAGAAGSNGGSSGGGAGGNGSASSISGSSVTYAGGGGGGGDARVNNGGSNSGGSGGGGNGGRSSTSWNATGGTANLGGGGGGGGYTGSGYGNGANGGSGIVIISYAGAQQFGGGIITSSGGNTIHTFTTSGTLSPLSSLTANFLVVAGGGGGGASYGGGGGAGGLRSSVTNTGGGGSLESALTIDTNSIYLVTVGAGGAGAVYTGSAAVSGSNSAFLSVTSTGGGRSGQFQIAGASGGSGGGGGAASGTGAAGGSGTANQGFAGGTGAGYNGVNGYAGGGGGGAGAVGQSRTALQDTGGAGGAGVTVAITGSSVGYAGGGGGSGYLASGGTATDGGGAGADYNVIGSSGAANKGGGGGGGGDTGAGSGNGGSGIVIISYPGSTPQMAGGTVTAAGGNIIHTFTSSGYLTPITNLNNSLRFRASASAYLNRTPTTTSNQKTFTWSGWVKRGTLGGSDAQFIFSARSANNDSGWFSFFFNLNDTLCVGGWSLNYRVTSQLFRDPAAWYHLVLAVDTTQATASNRVKVYVNGSEVTAFSTTNNPTQNFDYPVNSSSAAHSHGSVIGYASPYYFDGYMADISFVDGQALTPNSFGAFNGQGVWQPVRYGGSYGTNGFYLPFTNTTSTTTLGYDFSPNGNNWTPNNISLTTGSTYDSMTDVPTNTSATVANYCVLSPIIIGTYGAGTVTNAGLTIQTAVGGTTATFGSFAFPSTGKWYWEYIPIAGSVGPFGPETPYFSGIANSTLTNYVIYNVDGSKYVDGSGSSYGASYTTNDVIGVAVDTTNGTVAFYKNGVSQGNISYSFDGKTMHPALLDGSSTAQATYNVNFGQQPFAYTPPTGFVALNTFNLPTPTIGATPATTANKYMDVSLYTGTGSNQTITNSGLMQPDFLWIKSRSAATNHRLYDTIRGNNYLVSNSTAAEVSSGTVAIQSTGFIVGTDSDVNNSGSTYVGWQWNAASSNATNTSGSITSTVRANTTAGFSIVTATAPAAGVQGTVGHGLGVTPSMIIVKSRANAYSWSVYHASVCDTTSKYLRLNDTSALLTYSTVWGAALPTSSVFGITGDGAAFPSGTFVAYCFAQIAGYSAFGSYTGNGSTDGTFVYTGFRPKLIITKASSTTGNWNIIDTARNTTNVIGELLYADASDAGATYTLADSLSNGFKLRNSGGNINNSGTTFIYMAFAESPFKYANAR